MQRATAILIALCVTFLPVAGAAASAACAGMGQTSVQSGCCCGGESSCEMPGAADALTDACCGDDSETRTTAPTPVSTLVVQVEPAPLGGVFTGVNPVPVPRPRIPAAGGGPEHPPHYTLFCSLLI